MGSFSSSSYLTQHKGIEDDRVLSECRFLVVLQPPDGYPIELEREE